MATSETDNPTFLTPAKKYEKLTSQVEFLGNSQLASDMRNVPSGTSIVVLAIAWFAAFMLIMVVVPMVLWVMWFIREGRNKQRRGELSRSAIAYLSHTPVPESKLGMVSQFM